MNIFEVKDYRTYLDNLVKNNKKIAPQLNFQELSKTTRIAKSTISKVMNKKAHLNDDQLFLVCQFLELPYDDYAFLSLVLEWQRTTVTTKKIKLKTRIDALRQAGLNTEHYLQASQKLSDEPSELDYYHDVWVQIVHIFLTVRRYRIDPSLILRELNLTRRHLLNILRLLEQKRYINRDRETGVYEVLVEHVHLTKDSPFYLPWLRQLKSVCVEPIFNENSHIAPYSFSVTYSSDTESQLRIKARFLKFLQEVEADVDSSEKEQVFQMSFDMFSWDQKDKRSL